ncbi:MAG: heat-shock protein, partial [Azorhizobium sp. 32-67-21]
MAACGLDFGTSNTTLGFQTAAGPRLALLEGGADTLPSAIFYPRSGAPHVGRAAMAAYVGGEQGRLMRSLKAVLG